MMTRDHTHGPRPPIWVLFLESGGRIVVFATAVLLALTILSTQYFAQANAFVRDGITVSAMVKEKSEVTRDLDKGRTKEHWLVLVYSLPDGQMREVRKRADAVYFARVQEGERRDIRVLVGAPDQIALRPDEFRSRAETLRWIALGVGLLALWGLWRFGRRCVSALWARKYGRAIRATVAGVADSRLVWKDERGIPGRSFKGERTRYVPYLPDAEVELFVGPFGFAWWVGDLGPRAGTDGVPNIETR